MIVIVILIVILEGEEVSSEMSSCCWRVGIDIGGVGVWLANNLHLLVVVAIVHMTVGIVESLHCCWHCW